ncbi:Uncharacterised protein [Klebsiella pneumoniae]|nr:Uncharacterised protein [Klebsiella pneumoniae]
MKLSPGCTGGWEMYGTPSISIGRRMPCQWMVVGSSSLLVKRTRSHSPCFARNSTPGHWPP